MGRSDSCRFAGCQIVLHIQIVRPGPSSTHRQTHGLTGEIRLAEACYVWRSMTTFVIPHQGAEAGRRLRTSTTYVDSYRIRPFDHTARDWMGFVAKNNADGKSGSAYKTSPGRKMSTNSSHNSRTVPNRSFGLMAKAFATHGSMALGNSGRLA